MSAATCAKVRSRSSSGWDGRRVAPRRSAASTKRSGISTSEAGRLLAQFGGQAIDATHERRPVAFRKLAAETVAPFGVRRRELVVQLASAARQRHARGAEVVRIVLAMREPELL